IRVSNGIQSASNGCGPEWLAKYLNRVTHNRIKKCCDAHDLCYASCDLSRQFCDIKFKECIKKVRIKLKNTPVTWKEWLLLQGFMYGELVEIFGCVAYNQAQELSCICVEENKNFKVAIEETFSTNINYIEEHSTDTHIPCLNPIIWLPALILFRELIFYAVELFAWQSPLFCLCKMDEVFEKYLFEEERRRTLCKR
ncbi:group XIIA secretory phospholipase A2-like protein, partial [Leptotrombidium deliense]